MNEKVDTEAELDAETLKIKHPAIDDVLRQPRKELIETKL